MSRICRHLILGAALASCFAARASAEPETQTLSGHKGSVNALAFTPDGRLLATGGEDSSVRIWDVESGTEQKTIKISDGSITAVGWTADGRFVMYGGSDGHLRIADQRGREVKDTDYEATVHSISVSPVGTVAAVGFKKGMLRIINTATWTVTKEIDLGSSVESTAFSADGTQLAVGDSNATVTIFDPQTGKKMRRFAGHSDEIRSVAFNKDGTLLASASQDKTIRLWDPASGKAVRTINGHTDSVRGVTFSPDGTRLASVSSDSSVRTWDPSNGSECECWELGRDQGNCVAYTPDGKVLATGSGDKRVTLWYLKPSKKRDPVPPPTPPEPPKPDLKKITGDRIAALTSALKAFDTDAGYLPHSVNRGMVTALSGVRRGGYYRFEKSELNSSGEVIDGWGNPLIYRSPGSKGAAFDLYSAGPNGKDECGAGDDVGSW